MIAKRAQKITPFLVMDILERAKSLEKQTKDVIHLEIGEPDFDTPDCIKKAAIKAIKKGMIHYTHSLGLVELREAISEHYKKKYKVNISPEQVIVTAGSSPAMFLIFASILESSDEVIVPNPGYACYPNFIRFFKAKPMFVPVREENGFIYDLDDIKKVLSPHTKAIIINSPANPTGALIPKEVMEEIVKLKVLIVSDEIYHGLVYEGKEHSILEFSENAFVLNGFSKAYAMTGWRLGYVIAPKEFVRPIQRIQQNFFICAPTIAQFAAIAALKEADEDVKRMRQIYNKRRMLVFETLKEMGFSLTLPQGAFYFFINIKNITHDSYSLASDILEKVKVAVTPGIDFGSEGEGFIRISYANSLSNIKGGLKRIKKYFDLRKKG